MSKIIYHNIETVQDGGRILKTVTCTVIENGMVLVHQKDFVVIKDGTLYSILVNGSVVSTVEQNLLDYNLTLLFYNVPTTKHDTLKKQLTI